MVNQIAYIEQSIPMLNIFNKIIDWLTKNAPKNEQEKLEDELRGIEVHQ